jgi:hypothetical protein
LQVDGGSEFKNNVITLMKFKNVHIRIGITHENQDIIKRFNRTLEKKSFKIEDVKESLTEVVNTEWVKDLPDIIDDLNNSITRLLGITPNEAILKKMVFALPSKIPIDRPVGINEKRLSIGTTVRYLLDKSDYEGSRRQATDPIWSNKIFTIESSTIISRQPVMYKLVNGPKKYFIREKLLVVPPDTMNLLPLY